MVGLAVLGLSGDSVAVVWSDESAEGAKAAAAAALAVAGSLE